MWVSNRTHRMRLFMKLTLNGLLLPFFGWWGNRLVMRRGDRGNIPPCWGAAQITYIDRPNGQQMTVRHRKLRTIAAGAADGLEPGPAGADLSVPARPNGGPGFDGLTSEAFWEQQFFRARRNPDQLPPLAPARSLSRVRPRWPRPPHRPR